MDAIHVVIDTNVLIAALKSKRGCSHKLLLSLAEDLYIPNVSVPLFVEYESVARKEGMLAHLSAGDIEAILDYVLSKSNLREIFYLWRPFLKDPKDDLVLEVAVESQSKYIITVSKKDFKGIGKFGVEVLTPREFLMELGVLK